MEERLSRDGPPARMPRPSPFLRRIAFLAGLPLLSSPGCSIRKMAVNTLGDALASSGGVFASDDDVELVGDAIPFGLKTYESLLAESPEHRGLLLAAASGFAEYAYAYVQDEADRLDATDLARARELRARARRLYLRARNYALRGLEVAHPGFSEALRRDTRAALETTAKDDVPFLYWAGASWAGALTAAKDNLDLLADLPTAGDLVKRVLALDEGFASGAAHEFMISYEGSRPEAMGGSPARARAQYRRALEISRGLRASVHLALAEAVTIREQNLPEFRRLIAAALAVDPEAAPEQRLANTIARRRALRLESRIQELFVEADDRKETL